MRALAVRQRLRPGGRFFLAIWLAAAAGFIAMAALAAAFDRFPADLWVSHRLQDIDAAAFSRAVDWAEDFSDAPIVIILWLAAVAALFLAACRWEAALLLATILARPLNAGLKELIERPRPSPDLVRVADQPGTFSFPSGHTVGALVLYGLLFYLAAVLIRRPLLRLLVQVACLYVIALTALERIYVGHHWLSDVYGGLFFGGLCLALLIAAHRWRLAGGGHMC